MLSTLPAPEYSFDREQGCPERFCPASGLMDVIKSHTIGVIDVVWNPKSRDRIVPALGQMILAQEEYIR